MASETIFRCRSLSSARGGVLEAWRDLVFVEKDPVSGAQPPNV